MKILLAKYTSPSSGDVGYKWISKDPGINPSLLESVERYTTKLSPRDGRDIKDNDLLAGFLFLPEFSKAVAFRFIYGGRDALGRDGKVTMNCAFFLPSECKGKSLKGIFNEDFLKNADEEDKTAYADYTPHDCPGLAAYKRFELRENEKYRRFDNIDEVYSICADKAPPSPVLVEIKDTSNAKYAKLYSCTPKDAANISSSQENSSRKQYSTRHKDNMSNNTVRQNSGKTENSSLPISNISKKLIAALLIMLVIIISVGGVWVLRDSRISGKTPDTQKKHLFFLMDDNNEKIGEIKINGSQIKFIFSENIKIQKKDTSYDQSTKNEDDK